MNSKVILISNDNLKDNANEDEINKENEVL